MNDCHHSLTHCWHYIPITDGPYICCNCGKGKEDSKEEHGEFFHLVVLAALLQAQGKL